MEKRESHIFTETMKRLGSPNSILSHPIASRLEPPRRERLFARQAVCYPLGQCSPHPKEVHLLNCEDRPKRVRMLDTSHKATNGISAISRERGTGHGITLEIPPPGKEMRQEAGQSAAHHRPNMRVKSHSRIPDTWRQLDNVFVCPTRACSEHCKRYCH